MLRFISVSICSGRIQWVWGRRNGVFDPLGRARRSAFLHLSLKVCLGGVSSTEHRGSLVFLCVSWVHISAFFYTVLHMLLGVQWIKQDSFLFLITEILQSCKRSSLVGTNINRSGVVAKAPAPWRAQVERGDQSPRPRQQDSPAPPNPFQGGFFPIAPASLATAPLIKRTWPESRI